MRVSPGRGGGPITIPSPQMPWGTWCNSQTEFKLTCCNLKYVQNTPSSPKCWMLKTILQSLYVPGPQTQVQPATDSGYFYHLGVHLFNRHLSAYHMPSPALLLSYNHGTSEQPNS